MAEFGGMIASGLLKMVVQQICSVVGGQIKMHLNFNKDLEKMKMTLQSVEAVLKDAEKRSMTDNTVLLWLKQLKNAMYAISDVIDDFEAGSAATRKTARVHPDDVTMFTMHDLVHDLARSVMADEILVAGNHGNAWGSCCHYALLNDCSKSLESPRIRALHFMDSAEIGLHDATFSSPKSLRVLELSACSIHKLPNSIGRLKQLRYLNAPKVQATVISNNIRRLSKLIYLNLRGSSTILSLPESIGDIEGLMYLDLSGCSGMGKLPNSFGELKKL